MREIDNKLIAIVGPTAVGKTAVGIELAKTIGGEIISADSMQVYTGMDIGTEKPTPEEMNDVPHHLVSVVKPREPFAVALYQRMARDAISDIQKRGVYPILCGGTGLYVRAVIDKLEFPGGETASALRLALEERYKNEGAAALHEELARLDPEAAGVIPPQNVRRVIRALEVIAVTGRPFSEFRSNWQVREAIYDLQMFGLAMARSKLYAMIDSRVYKQLDKGLLDEVKTLVKEGYKGFLTASQAIGYKEFIAYLEGERSYDEAVDRIKKQTRHYAKRQLTWFRADPRITWIDATERSASDVAGAIVDKLIAVKFITQENPT